MFRIVFNIISVLSAFTWSDCPNPNRSDNTHPDVAEISCLPEHVWNISSLPLNSKCIVKCIFKNRWSKHFCWDLGWDQYPDDKYCIPTCPDPRKKYLGAEWSQCSSAPLKSGRYANNTICAGHCGNQSLNISCQFHGRWKSLTNESDCSSECPHPSKVYPGLDWNCPKSDVDNIIPMGSVCMSNCQRTFFKIVCQTGSTWADTGTSDFWPPRNCSCQDPGDIPEYSTSAWSCSGQENGVYVHEDVCSKVCQTEEPTNFQLSCQRNGMWKESGRNSECKCPNPNLAFPQVTWDCETTTKSCSGGCRGSLGEEQVFVINCEKDGSWTSPNSESQPAACYCQDPNESLVGSGWVCSVQKSTTVYVSGTICQGEVCPGAQTEVVCTQQGHWDLVIEEERSLANPCSCESDGSSSVILHGHIICNGNCWLQCDFGYVPKHSNLLICDLTTNSFKDLSMISCELPIALVIGGSANGEILSNAEFYSNDPEFECRRNIPDLPIGIYRSFGLWFDGKILVCGDNAHSVSVCYKLDRKVSESWTEIAAFLGGHDSEGVSLQGHVLVLGGEDTFHSIVEYDGFTEEFQMDEKELPGRIHSHCAVSLFNKTGHAVGILIMGGKWGASNTASKNTLLSKDSVHWSKFRDLAIKTSRPACLAMPFWIDKRGSITVLVIDTNCKSLQIGEYDPRASDIVWTK